MPWKEYLTSLREYHGQHGNNNQSIKVGDIVQIYDDAPRNTWKLAVIDELIKGRDGLIRAANLRTKNGPTNRPISKLYPIEVNQNSTEKLSIDRVSKLKAKENIKQWTK